MDNCLVCGAYEAVELGKPLILSDNQATRDYFRQGVIYAGDDVESISNSIQEMLKKHSELNASILVLKDILNREWRNKAIKLVEKIEQTA
jgi:glycosyltransferase involved in cell wall biosynthesis